jgi:hypothetical protein
MDYFLILRVGFLNSDIARCTFALCKRALLGDTEYFFMVLR